MTIATIAAEIGGILLTVVDIRVVKNTYLEMTEELEKLATKPGDENVLLDWKVRDSIPKIDGEEGVNA